jgi:ribosomal protein S18 acetylase RimI-like enzyme
MNLQIRPYCEADEASVAALWREAFPNAPAHNVPEEDIRRKLSVQKDLLLVALMDSRIVGTAMAGYDGHRGWVYYLAVSPAHRRRGIGTALMRHAEQALTAMGCPKLNLMVRGSNKEVLAFYEQLGYAADDVVTLSRRLKA